MADRPLKQTEILHAGPHIFDCGVRIDILPGCTRHVVQIAQQDLAAAEKKFDPPLPRRVGAMSVDADRLVLCLGPEEFLFLAPLGDKANLAAQLGSSSRKIPLSHVDIGHRQTALEISGRRSEALLSAGCPLDLHAMPVPGCTRSVFEGVQLVVMKLAPNRYRLEVANSYAPFVRDLLCKAGQEMDAQMALEHRP